MCETAVDRIAPRRRLAHLRGIDVERQIGLPAHGRIAARQFGIVDALRRRQRPARRAAAERLALRIAAA